MLEDMRVSDGAFKGRRPGASRIARNSVWLFVTGSQVNRVAAVAIRGGSLCIVPFSQGVDDLPSNNCAIKTAAEFVSIASS